ncbi:MAG TPA: DnaJ domain-containing protein [Bryobacteraceae bacterium]|nr:DnaJ domain-containing protein [Bryobacteraceae bacterium]
MQSYQTTRRSDFQDYYETLQISTNALPETIQRVYRLLAQHYHPDNPETGDVELFNDVLEAYRVLSDPESRAAYDVEHRMFSGIKWRIFEGASSMHGLDSERRKRIGILSLLCSKRMEAPATPYMSVFEVEEMLGCPREHLELSLWYLRETGRIQRTDNGKFTLTAKGLEMLEEHAESVSGKVRLLTPAKMATG